MAVWQCTRNFYARPEFLFFCRARQKWREKTIKHPEDRDRRRGGGVDRELGRGETYCSRTRGQ